MKLNIFTKLFLAVLIATVVVILFMAIFMNWSFRRGFADYQHQAELARVNILSSTLSNEYRSQQNWDFLRNNPRGWQAILLKLGDASAMRALSTRMRLRDTAGLLVSGSETAIQTPHHRINVIVKNNVTIHPHKMIELF